MASTSTTVADSVAKESKHYFSNFSMVTHGKTTQADWQWVHAVLYIANAIVPPQWVVKQIS